MQALTSKNTSFGGSPRGCPLLGQWSQPEHYSLWLVNVILEIHCVKLRSSASFNQGHQQCQQRSPWKWMLIRATFASFSSLRVGAFLQVISWKKVLHATMVCTRTCNMIVSKVLKSSNEQGNIFRGHSAYCRLEHRVNFGDSTIARLSQMLMQLRCFSVVTQDGEAVWSMYLNKSVLVLDCVRFEASLPNHIGFIAKWYWTQCLII